MPDSHSIAPWFIAGPTGVGKSAVALALAAKIDGEIISVDSMQVYRGLDIGTAKPGPAERSLVPHHLLDVVDVTGSFDAARFVSLAGAAVAEIQAKGRVPIFCGGTGLYFKAWLDGIGSSPPAHPDLRRQLEATPLGDLLRELEESDAATFQRIDRQNPRRVIRAVEVIRLTGRPFSGQQSDWQRPPVPVEHFFCLERTSADLHQRISVRVDQMFAQGLVAETRALLEPLSQNPAAMQAIGYRQVVAHLRGEHSLAETIELVKIKTRQFVKRQLTWFRKYLPAQWLMLAPEESPDQTLVRLLSPANSPR